MLFEIRYGVVFRTNGLDLDGVTKDLSKYGRVDEDIYDDIFGDEPVKIIIVSCDLSGALSLKRDYNCVEAEDNKYILFPMENYEERMKVLSKRGAR